MRRLIKNEIIKIYKKKSFLIVTVIFILYALLTNLIYKNVNGIEENKESIKELELINKELDLNKEEEIDTYINNISKIEAFKLKEKFSGDSTDYLVDTYLYNNIYNQKVNEFKTKNPNLDIELKVEYNILYTKIKNDDFKYFIDLKIKELEEEINHTTSLIEKRVFEDIIKLYKYQLDNNIPFNTNNYLYNSLDFLKSNLREYYNLSNKKVLSKEEKKRLDSLTKDININKYIIENKVDILDNTSLYAVLKNFANEFELFILIYIVLISGSVISEEFNKGTIKFLLTKPFKRNKILTSKLITILILMPLIILFMIITEIILGGLILGFDSLKIPVLLFKSSTNSLVIMSVIKYLLLSLLANTPAYLVLIIFSFMISTLTLSTSAAITLTFLLYLIGNVINGLALSFSLKIFKLFVSLHWDFSYLVNYSINPYNISFKISLMVVLIYICIMLFITYLAFNKKDVKNI